MELLKKDDTTVQLVCECGSNTFRIEFRMSEAVQRYEELNPGAHRPDNQILICTVCATEIEILETEARMPIQTLTEEVQAMLIVSAAQRATRQPYRWNEEGEPVYGHRVNPFEAEPGDFATWGPDGLKVYRNDDEAAAKEELQRQQAEQEVRGWFDADTGRAPEDDWGK
jgi:hypothetical protein